MQSQPGRGSPLHDDTIQDDSATHPAHTALSSHSRFSVVAASDCGRRRKVNQDRYFADTRAGVIVLADGMGGHNSGELAAQIAVDGVSSRLMQRAAAGSDKARNDDLPIASLLTQALDEANADIFTRGQDAEHKGMGTTAIAALLNGATLHAAHVGDSRLYLYRRGELQQLSRDHSRLQELIDEGFFTVRDSRRSGIGHVLTRALGNAASVSSDAIECELEDEDVLLFCSDGLSDLVDDWQITDTLGECRGDLARTCRKLIDHANRNGGTDNITAVLARYEDA